MTKKVDNNMITSLNLKIWIGIFTLNTIYNTLISNSVLSRRSEKRGVYP